MKPDSIELKAYLLQYVPYGIRVYVFPDETISNGWLTTYKIKHPDGIYNPQVTFDNYLKFSEAGYKPILRPLSDISGPEHIESSIAYTDAMALISFDFSEWYREWFGEAARSKYLISKGFNLFDPSWKHSIDKTKL